MVLDVVLAKVAAGLHLYQFERDFSLKPVVVSDLSRRVTGISFADGVTTIGIGGVDNGQ